MTYKKPMGCYIQLAGDTKLEGKRPGMANCQGGRLGRQIVQGGENVHGNHLGEKLAKMSRESVWWVGMSK